jgi:HSP20 family protein
MIELTTLPPAADPDTTESLAALEQEIAWTHPEARPLAPLDVEDCVDHFRVLMDLPGVREEDIDIVCEDSTLTIAGERKTENRHRTYHRERRFGSFARTVTLRGPIDVDRVEASCRDGVLEVRLPKARSASLHPSHCG